MAFFKHFHTISKHRRQVLRNAAHMGIFFFALHHDLSKWSPQELFPSAKYYAGDHSPVDNQRKANGGFSTICQHHTKRNPHHWEYWVDFYGGCLVVKTMPYKWAVEFVCDCLSASKVYNGKNYRPDSALSFFDSRSVRYYMTAATKEFLRWCLVQFAESGWEHLKKKETKSVYAEIVSRHPDVEIIRELNPVNELPFGKTAV